LRRKLRELRALLGERAGSVGHWRDRARATVIAIGEWLERTPAYRADVAFHYKAFAKTHPGVAAEFGAFLEFYRFFVASLFREAVESGELVEKRQGEIAETFRALVSGFLEESIMHFDKPADIAEKADLITDVIGNAFGRGGGDD